MLRPEGRADGRRVCRICARRLFEWVGAHSPGAQPEAVETIWPSLREDVSGDDPALKAARSAFYEDVAARLPELDPSDRMGIALVCLDAGLLARALDAFGTIDGGIVEKMGERALASLLSRLLHPSILAEEARERLAGALYPEPASGT